MKLIEPGQVFDIPTDERELLQFIAGNGPWKLVGNGIRTYPRGDENDRQIHAACERLESKGLIYRERNEPERCFFRAR